MNNRGFLNISFTLIAGLLFLTSCGGPVKRADALVTVEGKIAGVIVEYKSAIDKNSITKDSYEFTPKQEIARYFVSDSNPFKKDNGKRVEKANGGKYVVVLLKDSPEAATLKFDLDSKYDAPELDFSVRQVSPVTSLTGKPVNGWDKSIKAKDYFVVPGGMSK